MMSSGFCISLAGGVVTVTKKKWKDRKVREWRMERSAEWLELGMEGFERDTNWLKRGTDGHKKWKRTRAFEASSELYRERDH